MKGIKLYKWSTILIILIFGCKAGGNLNKNISKYDSEILLEPLIKRGLYLDLKQHTSFTGVKFHSFDISEDESMLIFSAQVEGEYYHIYAQNPYHKSFFQITSGNSNNTFPHLSSDKKKVTFLSDRNGTPNVYIIDLDKTFMVAQVTDDKSEKFLPILSPDNSKILYTSKENDKYILVIIDLGTKVKTFLGEGVGFSWTQNNKILFIKPYLSKANTLWTIDVENLNVSQVIYDTKKYILFPTSNLKGNMVSYSKISQPTNLEKILSGIFPPISEIWLNIIEDNKRSEYLIINDEYVNFNPHITGNRIYFISDRNGAENIWSIKADIGTP